MPASSGFISKPVSLEGLLRLLHYYDEHRPTSPASTIPSPCRLLLLPPELRNKIYELVLGGHVIHIHLVGGDGRGNRPDSKLRSRICIATESDEEIISTLMHANDDRDEFNSYDERHSICGYAGLPGSNYPLSLLLTCRQIYKETKHLPLEANTFSFYDDSDLDQFCIALTNLTPDEEMRGRVTSIILGDQTLAYPISLWGAPFQNLHKVTIFYSIHSRIFEDVGLVFWKLTDKDHETCIEDGEDIGAWCRKEVIAFEPNKIESVLACVHYAPGTAKEAAEEGFLSR